MSNLFSLLADASGVLALFLSSYTLIRDHLRNRQRFSIDVIDYDVRGHSARFYISFSNLSHRPLIITGIIYRETLCELDPKRIRKPPDPLPFQHTPQFPLAIEALGAGLYYIEFLSPSHKQLSRGIPVTFQIHTISQSVSKTVLLGDKSHYLHNGQ